MKEYFAGWNWKPKNGHKMINKVSSTIQVGSYLHCMTNCTVSPICDSYNYHPSDRTCQFNTHDTPLIANSTDIVVDNAWIWYSTTFTVVAWTTPYNWQRRLHRVTFSYFAPIDSVTKTLYCQAAHTADNAVYLSTITLFCWKRQHGAMLCHVMTAENMDFVIRRFVSVTVCQGRSDGGVYRYIYPPRGYIGIYTPQNH